MKAAADGLRPIADGDLERIRESLRSELLDRVQPPARHWVEVMQVDLERLLDFVQHEHGKQGGTFATNLRAALEERILAHIAQRVVLTNDTEEKSFSVHVTPQGVFVDVRLQIGVWRG